LTLTFGHLRETKKTSNQQVVAYKETEETVHGLTKFLPKTLTNFLELNRSTFIQLLGYCVLLAQQAATCPDLMNVFSDSGRLKALGLKGYEDRARLLNYFTDVLLHRLLPDELRCNFLKVLLLSTDDYALFWTNRIAFRLSDYDQNEKSTFLQDIHRLLCTLEQSQDAIASIAHSARISLEGTWNAVLNLQLELEPIGFAPVFQSQFKEESEKNPNQYREASGYTPYY